MWEMIKAEFRHIRRNRLLLLSFIVICFIPFLYSIFFLKSVWDPYGSTQNLPVAVVNEDRAVKYQGQTLKVGAQLVQELRKNKQLKWEIVSKQTAKEGLAHRKYYTVVTIPKDFSKNAATVLDQSPKKMELKYETNGSLNYIGQVISEMAMTKLNQKIRAQVTQSYATTMIKLVKQVGTGFNQAASGAKQISTGMVTLNSGTNQFVAGVSTVNNGVQTLQAAVTPLASGASQLASGSTTLASGVNQYTSGVGLLAAGLTKLSANSAALNAGTATLASGVNQYTSGVDQLGSGLTTLKNNSASLRSGAASLNQGASQLSNGASQLNATVNSSLGSLDFTGIMSAMNQASQMKSSLASLQSGLTQGPERPFRGQHRSEPVKNGFKCLKWGQLGPERGGPKRRRDRPVGRRLGPVDHRRHHQGPARDDCPKGPVQRDDHPGLGDGFKSGQQLEHQPERPAKPT